MIFSATFIWNFFILRRTVRDIVINTPGSRVSDFNQIWKFSVSFSGGPQYKISQDVPCGRADRHTKPIVAFRNFGNEHKKEIRARHGTPSTPPTLLPRIPMLYWRGRKERCVRDRTIDYSFSVDPRIHMSWRIIAFHPRPTISAGPTSFIRSSQEHFSDRLFAITYVDIGRVLQTTSRCFFSRHNPASKEKRQVTRNLRAKLQESVAGCNIENSAVILAPNV